MINMSSTLTIHHIAFKSDNLESYCHFYENVFQIKAEKTLHDETGHVRSKWYRIGSVILMLERRDTAPNTSQLTPEHRNTFVFSIKKNEKEIWRTHLQAQNISLCSESPYTIYFLDPEGQRLGLSHYPD